MPEVPATDLRGSPDATVLSALSERDPVALAEACGRTLGAAAAVARRMLPPADAEWALHAVYSELWEDPPAAGQPLEGWVRARCFAVCEGALRVRGAAPSAPSVRAAAPHLPSRTAAYLDAAERGLAALDDATREAVVRAHDAGVPSRDRAGAPDAGRALLRGLLALAEADTALPAGVDDRLGDWVLGLLGPHESAAVRAWLGDLDRGPHVGLVRSLRRGRRRLEGLPPPPDVGLRVLARVLGGHRPPPEPKPEAPARPADPPQSALGAQQGEEADPRVAALLERDPPPAKSALDTDQTPDADPPSPAAGWGPSRRRAGRRVTGLLGGVLLVAVGIALGLFVVGPLVVDWVAGLLD